MKAYLIFFTYIYSCILRKKEHCLDYKIFQDRKFPDYLIKPCVNSEIVVQNETTQIHNEDTEIIDLTVDQPECKRLKYVSHRDCTNYGENSLIVKAAQNKHLSEGLIDSKMKKIISIYHEFDLVNLKEIYKKFISGDLENLSEIIKLFLQKYVKRSYLKNYLSRIKSLDSTYKLLNNKETHFAKRLHLFDSLDKKLLEILEKLVTAFGSNNNFSEKEYYQFIMQLDEDLSKTNGFIDIKRHLISICLENKRYLYFSELINCTKYFVSFPELMTLGGIETRSSINNVIVPVHLLNLLLTGRKNVEEVKTIVLFLIKKAFSSTHRNGLSFFQIDMLQIKCWANQEKIHEKNFNFFLWEMNNKRRQDFGMKLQDITVLFCSDADETHLNSVLLIFLYQQIIFLRINNGNEDIIKKYISLIDGIFSLQESCPGCIFDKFLEVLSE